MNDTPEHMAKKQFEIIAAKPLEERLRMGFEMIEMSRGIIKSRIKEKNPGMSDMDLKAELFKTFYRFDFEEDELKRISEHLRNCRD